MSITVILENIEHINQLILNNLNNKCRFYISQCVQYNIIEI